MADRGGHQFSPAYSPRRIPEDVCALSLTLPAGWWNTESGPNTGEPQGTCGSTPPASDLAALRYCRCCKPSALSELPTFLEVVTLIGDCRWKVTSVSVG